MTIGNYISAVRVKLSDTVQPYRYQPSEIADQLRAALWRARQMRPSLCYADGRLVQVDADVNFGAAVSTVVRPELDRYFDGLVMLAAAGVVENDTGDKVDIALAERWRTQGQGIIVA